MHTTNKFGKKSRNVKIIAEIGINHNGDISLARSLIDKSIEAGVDSIKFQYRNLERCYGLKINEIGDEILRTEITRSYIPPGDLIELTKYAKKNDLEVGISFFSIEDSFDFGGDISLFDFYKIPSPLFQNINLIEFFLQTGKEVYISTGAQNERDIEKVLGSLSRTNWTIFHCISNYPTELFNSKLGYLTYLRDKWSRDVGYSSHDNRWEACVAAIALGAKYIERHITLDKNMNGLDHTTSSTPDEMALLVDFAKYSSLMLSGDSDRIPNQGELMNLQNLGRSYHYASNLKVGHKVKIQDLCFISPATGLGESEIKEFLGRELLEPVYANEPMVSSNFILCPALNKEYVESSNHHKITLPARFHDLQSLRNRLPLEGIELHLSFNELFSEIDYSIFSTAETYSIHLPDYISSTELINPFSPDSMVRDLSLEIIAKAKKLASYLYGLTGKSVPIVASLSVVNETKDIFYLNCKELTVKSSDVESFLCMQILPPFAWYFGGSIPINVFSDKSGWEKIAELDIPITLDLSHLMMSCKFFNHNLTEAVNLLLPHTRHIHLSLAEGYDGEGKGFKNCSELELSVLKLLLKQRYMKVIEVWQGHLNKFAGFHEAIVDLSDIIK